MPPYFGPSGNSAIFYEQGYKSSLQAPRWIFNLGLTAYEYPCGKGIKIRESTAKALGEEAQKYNLKMSLHSPYYINLGTDDEEKREKTLGYIMQSLETARFLGATRVVVHSGAFGKRDRESGIMLATQTLKLAIERADYYGFGDIHLCPETMGKINQLGTLDEVMSLCQIDDRLLPTIDFGHLNARSLGGLKTYGDFQKIFDTIENKLGKDRLNQFHAHFSKIEYGMGGEKRHLTFEDTEYGPDFDFAALLIAERGLSPTIICESKETMAEDALTMQKIYQAKEL